MLVPSISSIFLHLCLQLPPLCSVVLCCAVAVCAIEESLELVGPDAYPEDLPRPDEVESRWSAVVSLALSHLPEAQELTSMFDVVIATSPHRRQQTTPSDVRR
jgi:hypothetical protein